MKNCINGLVTLIIPGYNVEKLVQRLLDSILIQDYPSIQCIFVNDGSTDNTGKVLHDYIQKFNEKDGYSLEIIQQNNFGQAAAICKALPKVKGEFLAWPDADDYYKSSTSIRSFVSKFHELSNDYGIVRCLPTFIDEHSLKEVSQNVKYDHNTNLFESCLYNRKFIWPPINYMVRTEAFDNVNPNRDLFHIYHSGQNWQMLLPLLYSYKGFTFEESFSCVLVRGSSHSRNIANDFQKQLHYHLDINEHVIINTLDRIFELPQEKRDFYKKEIIIKYSLTALELSMKANDVNKALMYYYRLKCYGINLPIKTRLKIEFLKYPKTYKAIQRIKSFIR